MKKGTVWSGVFLWVMMLILPWISVGGGEFSQNDSSSTAPEAGVTEEAVRVWHHESETLREYSKNDYLFGVVAAEMSADAPEEALKAQAVAAYTILCRRKQEESRKTDRPGVAAGADISDDHRFDQSFLTREQVKERWGEQYSTRAERLDRILEEVSDLAVMYRDEPADTVYHAISPGKTESAQVVWGSDVPYLISVESVGDLLAADYWSEAVLTPEEFRAGLPGEVTLGEDPAGWLGECNYSSSGTVVSLKVGESSMTGSQLRQAFSLRSANFDLVYQEGAFRFTVRGYGHGVGMSQHGACCMAEQGSGFEEILLWYYPGCRVEKFTNRS